MDTTAIPNAPVKLIPWVEKYRPDKVDEISHQDEVVRTLKTSIENGNLPHLLFHGPPGKIEYREYSNKFHLYFCCTCMFRYGENYYRSGIGKGFIWTFLIQTARS